MLISKNMQVLEASSALQSMLSVDSHAWPAAFGNAVEHNVAKILECLAISD